MAHFQAIGVIATDLVRRETKNGVLASFRLQTGTPGRGQLWITVEAWGHTAGVLHTHASTGRGVAIAGRLTSKSWRDRSSGEKRSTLVVTASDFDFIEPGLDTTQLGIANQVTAFGRVDSPPVFDSTGGRALFTLVSGSAGSKTGRLWLPVEAWGRTVERSRDLRSGDHVAVTGRLNYQSRPDANGEKTGAHELSAYALYRLNRHYAGALP